MKLVTDEAPLPVKLTAKAEGVIATTAATATTAAFENILKRMVCLSLMNNPLVNALFSNE
jgi:hypothetical protein